jgi:hypothetical protein
VCRLTYNDEVVRQLRMRVNIKGCDQVAPLRRGERISPAGTFDSSPLRSGGKGVKDSSVPEGRSNAQSLARIRPRERKRPIDRPLRDGSLLKKCDPPLRSGLLSNVPSSFALWATADRPGRGPLRMLLSLMLTRMWRLPDRLRIDSDMRPPTASPARTALPTAHFERNDVTIICEAVH